jgi:hypothetical protein
MSLTVSLYLSGYSPLLARFLQHVPLLFAESTASLMRLITALNRDTARSVDVLVVTGLPTLTNQGCQDRTSNLCLTCLSPPSTGRAVE